MAMMSTKNLTEILSHAIASGNVNPKDLMTALEAACCDGPALQSTEGLIDPGDLYFDAHMADLREGFDKSIRALTRMGF